VPYSIKKGVEKMEIKCQATKRFLFNIDIETYYNNLKKLGVDITTPLVIEIPCQKCKMIEVYEIYPTHYIHTKSYKRN
jgi:hypothetical protein